jgi:GNAT superfamily N-acetyltransferase
VIIREFQPSDQSQINALHEASHGEVHANVPDGFFQDLDDIENNFLPRGAFYVAEVEGVIVGMGGMIKTDENSGEIVRMRTHPDFQRRGIGFAILEALERSALELGLKRLHLHTLITQTKAQALYEKAGFTCIGRGVIEGNEVMGYEKALGRDSSTK